MTTTKAPPVADQVPSVDPGRSRWPKVRPGRVLLYLMLIVVTVLFGAPYLWMLVTSLKPESEIFSYPPQWIPASPTLEPYLRLFESFAIGAWFLNSLIVAVITTVLTVSLSALAAYPLARMAFLGKRFVFLMILATFLIPYEVLLVPLFMGLSRAGITDSYFSLAVPPAANAFSIFLLAQFFRKIPTELEDAALVDGCSRWSVFVRILLPLSKPALATVTIFAFMNSWNNFFWPLIITNSDATRTLPVGLATMVAGSGLGESFGILMASAVVATLPALAVFLIFQRQFVQGVATTGLRG